MSVGAVVLVIVGIAAMLIGWSAFLTYVLIPLLARRWPWLRP